MERVDTRQFRIKEVDVDRRSERTKFFIEVAKEALAIRNEVQAQLGEDLVMSPTTLVVGKDFMAYFWLSHHAEEDDLYNITGDVSYIDTSSYETFGEAFSLLDEVANLPPRVTVVSLDGENWRTLRGAPFEVRKSDDYEVLFYQFTTGREVEAFVCL